MASLLTATLDIVGVLVLFRWAPEKFPDPQSTVSFALEDGSQGHWRAAQVVRAKVAHVGVGLIVLGFGLQLFAILLPESS